EFCLCPCLPPPDLEQRILEVLRDSGSPVKTAQLVKKCQVPKKKLSQVLHKMKKESKGVLLVGPATWSDSASGVLLNHLLSCLPEEEIFRFLETHGPHRALIIAQALGMKTAKEVNPDLYAMRNKHLLDLDQKSNSWAIYQPGRAEGRAVKRKNNTQHPSTPVIYQQNPINMISQNGPSSHISIENSKGIQIGHGNVIVRKMASGENGSTAPLYLPPMAPTDPSTQGPLAGSWGPQDIRMEKSVLRHVQMGHGNEMSLHGSPAKGPAHSACGSPPVSVLGTGPEASIEIQIPEPGPHSEGGMAQRVHIRSCFLEDTTVGNNNKMTINPGAAHPGGVARASEPGGSAGEPGTPLRSFIHAPTQAPLPPSNAPSPGDTAKSTDRQILPAHRGQSPVGTRDSHKPSLSRLLRPTL
uniref:Z-binding domain-containing protein n=1 Tax=Balaenoptera musculus TaxID=9771 RepID=A0A8C0I2J5_BALMU